MTRPLMARSLMGVLSSRDESTGMRDLVTHHSADMCSKVDPALIETCCGFKCYRTASAI